MQFSAFHNSIYVAKFSAAKLRVSKLYIAQASELSPTYFPLLGVGDADDAKALENGRVLSAWRDPGSPNHHDLQTDWELHTYPI